MSMTNEVKQFDESGREIKSLIVKKFGSGFGIRVVEYTDGGIKMYFKKPKGMKSEDFNKYCIQLTKTFEMLGVEGKRVEL